MKSLIRGREVSRVEAFSDAVFGFAATLLVVSLEVPSTFPQLIDSLYGFPAFGISFGALILIWSAHNGFFRRYALQDNVTITLNSLLLFVVLFYVYPLKFMTRSFVQWAFGLESHTGSAIGFRGPEDLSHLFILYGLGFIAVFGAFALLYRHALRLGEKLELSASERIEGEHLMRHYLLCALAGAISILVAWSGIGVRFGLPGWAYGLLGPLCYWNAKTAEKRKAAIEPALSELP